MSSSQGKGIGSNGNIIASAVTKEYLEAVSLMNEDTMSRACRLLLMIYNDDEATDSANAEPSSSSMPTRTPAHPSKNRGHETPGQSYNNDNDTIDIKDQLLGMYHTCQESLDVIYKQQLLPDIESATIKASYNKKGMKLPPVAPGLNGIKKRTIMTTKHVIHPSHKVAATAITPGVGGLKQKGMMPMSMRRVSSLKIVAKTSTSPAAQGKSMSRVGRRRALSPTQSTLPCHYDSASSSSAPPPNAVSFLAKLNRDPNEVLASDDSSAIHSRTSNNKKHEHKFSTDGNSDAEDGEGNNNNKEHNDDKKLRMFQRGTVVSVPFDDGLYYEGSIISFDSHRKKYKILYDDGEIEQMSFDDVKKYLKPKQEDRRDEDRGGHKIKRRRSRRDNRSSSNDSPSHKRQKPPKSGEKETWNRLAEDYLSSFGGSSRSGEKE